MAATFVQRWGCYSWMHSFMSFECIRYRMRFQIMHIGIFVPIDVPILLPEFGQWTSVATPPLIPMMLCRIRQTDQYSFFDHCRRCHLFSIPLTVSSEEFLILFSAFVKVFARTKPIIVFSYPDNYLLYFGVVWWVEFLWNTENVFKFRYIFLLLFCYFSQ